MEGYGNENPGAFQPTRPLRGATKVAHADWLRVPAISTHAPLAGRDGCGMTCCTHTTNFNPRAPCGARLTPRRSRCYRIGNFNPRAPCGARQRSGANRRAARYFNPRAPCGARLNWLTVYELKPDISTHAPLAGRDIFASAGERTHGISTHAPLAGRDACRRPSLTLRWNFNPRAPCGARRHPWSCSRSLRAFQPTRPLRGATNMLFLLFSVMRFQPTRPLRGATPPPPVSPPPPEISTHAPLAGRDHGRHGSVRACQISTHAPLAGRDRPQGSSIGRPTDFNPRAPCGARRLTS